MKQTLLIVALFIVNSVNSQKNNTSTVATNIDMQLYNSALRYNDANVAIASLHKIILNEGENSIYKDTLATVYFKSNNFVSTYLITKELLLKNPTNVHLLEMNATALQKLGNAKEATSAFEKLFNITKNQYHGYQLALLQYALQRLAEANVSLSLAMNGQELKDVVVPMAATNNQTQRVPLKAAMLNLKGLISYAQKDANNATQSFEQALQIMPDFETAKQNKLDVENELAVNVAKVLPSVKTAAPTKNK